MDDLHCNSIRCRKALSLEMNLAYWTALSGGHNMNFYTYQVQQEGAFQALILKNAQERVAVLEAQLSTVMTEAKHKIALLEERISRTDKELELERRKVREQQELHKSNAKAYNKLKAQYDKAKQKALTHATETQHSVGGQIPGPFTSANATAPRHHFASVGGNATPARSGSNVSSVFASGGNVPVSHQNRMPFGEAHGQVNGGFNTGQVNGLASGRGDQTMSQHDFHPNETISKHRSKHHHGVTAQFGQAGVPAPFGMSPSAFGLQPMPTNFGRFNHARRDSQSAGSGGSGSGGAGTGVGRGGQHGPQDSMPEYLGQQSLGSARKQPAPGMFRPAGVGHL
ncbi:hypothetical protein OIO90_004170 [Microbotryomycetes sp. JL221]|nr:hypothetical protein OIO90_004170 [Microbotryomycetes sp. JL221]